MHEHDQIYKCGWLSLCFAFLVSFELSFDIKGELKPDEAMKALTIFEGKFSRLKEERENVAKAKEALELSEPGNFVKKNKRCLKMLLYDVCKIIFLTLALDGSGINSGQCFISRSKIIPSNNEFYPSN